MSYEIDQRKVIGVLLEANGAIADKGFNHGEVVLGLAELSGRTIVEVAETSLQSGEFLKVGAEAQEKRIITAG